MCNLPTVGVFLRRSESSPGVEPVIIQQDCHVIVPMRGCMLLPDPDVSESAGIKAISFTLLTGSIRIKLRLQRTNEAGDDAGVRLVAYSRKLQIDPEDASSTMFCKRVTENIMNTDQELFYQHALLTLDRKSMPVRCLYQGQIRVVGVANVHHVASSGGCSSTRCAATYLLTDHSSLRLCQ